MTDLSQLPPLHPERIKEARASLLWVRDPNVIPDSPEHDAFRLAETNLAALEVVQKLQTGFGFAPDLYDKVEMAKTTVAQGRTILGLLKGLTGKK